MASGYPKLTWAAALTLLIVWMVPASAQSAAEVDARLHMAGIDDSGDVREFLADLKSAATSGDRQELAGMILYPLTMWKDGEAGKIYETREALLQDFEAVFTPGVLSAIEAAEYENLFIRDQGAMIGNGEIWFTGWGGSIQIKTVNPPETSSAADVDSQRPAASSRGSLLWAQEMLNMLGYDAGPADGAMGRRTRRAVSAFQKDRGLRVNGVVDYLTVAQLAAEEGIDQPAFDCRKAEAFVELAICGSRTLSRLDAELSEAFRNRRESLPAVEAEADLLRQRAWLATRDACESEIPCIERAYRERLSELSAQALAGAADAEQESDAPAAETISILGAEFIVVSSPYLNEIPAEWENVRAYVPEWLHAEPDDPIDDAGRLRFVKELEAEMAGRMSREIASILERRLDDYLELWPDRNRDYFELELAGMCYADESGGYIPRSTLALCQEYVALSFVAAIIKTAQQADPSPPVSPPVAAEPIADHPPKPLETFKDCETCPEMVVLPAGSYWMGSDGRDAVRWYLDTGMLDGAFSHLDPRIPIADQGDSEDLTFGGDSVERPRHQVTLDYQFAIGRYELTVAEYRAFLDETGYEVSGNCYTYEPDPRVSPEVFRNTRYPEILELTELVRAQTGFRPEHSFLDPGYAQTDRHPAVCVSVTDASAYLDWQSEKTGRRYRLPSEAEWEYAARGGTETAYSFGDNVLELCDYSNFTDGGSSQPASGLAACDDGYDETPAPVGSYKANPFGLYDVHGNVFEPVQDCFHPDYVGAPVDGSPWRDVACSSGNHVLRSYSYFGNPYFAVRSAARCPAGEELGRSSMTGIRVVVSMTSGAWDLK